MKDDVRNLLLRSFDETLAPVERDRLHELLEQSDEVRAERDRLTRLRAMVTASKAESFGPGFADRVMRSTRSAEAPEPGWLERMALLRTPRQWVGGLAAALVVAAVGITLWLQPRTVSVPYGQTEIVALSDGSTVELSGGSRLTFKRRLGREFRRVVLEGEAFFNVRAEDRPFLVETFNATIRVLGTQFNVRAWSDDPIPETDVVVAEGRVTVEPRASEGAPASSERAETLMMQRAAGPLTLEAGEAASVADSAALPRTASLQRTLTWRTGGLAFTDQSMESVVRALERRFAVRISAPDASVLARPVTYLNPSPESAEAVVADICHTLDLRYRRTAGGFEILHQ